MTREVTDQLYIELGYLTPEDYYTYQAEAQVAQAAEATMSVTVGVIKSADAVLESQFTQTATLSHIYGADLFAFSEAALAAEASRIRDNNIAANSAFDVAVDSGRIIVFSSEEDAVVTVSIDSLRVRGLEAAVDAAFSLAADAELIPGGVTEQGQADLSSNFEVALDAQLIKTTPVDIASTVELFAVISHIEGADLVAFTDTSVSADIMVMRGLESQQDLQAQTQIDIEAIRGFDSQLSSSADLTASTLRIKQLSADLTDAFVPTVNVEAVKNTFAVLDSQASLDSSVNTIRSLEATISSAVTATVTVTALTEFWIREYPSGGKVSSYESSDADSQGNVYSVVTRTQDRIPKSPSVFGNAQISTTQSKFGGSSLLLDGTGDYLKFNSENDFAFGTGDFTAELWVYRTVTSGYDSLIDMRTTSTDNALIIGLNGSVPYIYIAGAFRIQAGSAPLNTWNHIAYVRQGTTGKLYVNGSSVGSWTDNINYSAKPLVIGADNLGNNGTNGYLDEIRLTKGLARYTSNFSVPTKSFRSDDNTILLLHFNGAASSTVIEDDVTRPSILTKRDSKGTLIWSKEESAISRGIYDVKVANDTSIYVAGSTSVGAERSLLVKIDNSGSVQWQRSLATTSNIRALRLDADSSGNPIIQVGTGTTGNGWLAKYATDGSLLFQSQTSNNDSVPYFDLDSSNNLVYVGSNDPANPSSNTTLYVNKLASGGGSFVWRKSIAFTGATNSRISTPVVAVDSQNNVYVALTYAQGSTLEYNKCILKLDSSGNLLWSNFVVLNSNRPVTGIVALESGNPVIVTEQGHFAEFDSQTGSVVWAKSLTTDNDSIFTKLENYKNGALLGFGYLFNASTGYNGITFKLPANSTGVTEDKWNYTDLSTSGGFSKTVTASNTTVPTIASSNFSNVVPTDFTYTDVSISENLYNIFDTGFYQNTSASLASTSAVSVQGGKNVVANADINAESVVTAGLSKVVDASADITAQGFVVAAFGRIRPFASLEDTSFSVTADISVQKTLTADISAEFTQSVDATKTLGPVLADLTATSTLTAVVNKSTDIVLICSDFATITANAVKTADNSSNQSSITQVTAQGDAGKLAQANLSSEFTQTATATKQFGNITADLTSQTDLTASSNITSGNVIAMSSTGFMVAAFGRIRPFASLEDTSFNLTADAVAGKIADSTMSATTELTADAAKQFGEFTIDAQVTSTMSVDAVIKTGSVIVLEPTANISTDADAVRTLTAAIESAMTFTANVRETSDISADLSSEFTIVADLIKTARATVNLTTASTITVEASRTRSGISLEFSFADAEVDADVIRTLTSNMSATTNATATARKLVSISAGLSSQGFVLAIGREFRLEDSAIWRVPAETNTYKIQTEVTDWIVPLEVRSYTIKE